uniref:tRNA-dihydrouridine(16/17) synthase [NAD(P)(+)] n=1 Tax=Elaeophora elaphi TaxID=1147741 RepID=A0A0R3RPP9_9BILA
MEDGNNGLILHVGKHVSYEESPPELDESQKLAKKVSWRKRIERIRCVVAPMVDQSELAFRMMLRKHGAHLCFSPMIHAHLFVTDSTYRRTALSTCLDDRPLIVQFCANDPVTLLTACQLVENFCDGVDLNLGCPQLIAKRGHYGAYLQEDLKLICEMIALLHSRLRLPLSCKIRILQNINETVAALVKAGACMLTVHGRTREQRGPNTGLADWCAMRAVVNAVDVPVLANGNIQLPGDVDRCLEITGANAIMSAEGILSNPYLFEKRHEVNWIVAREYLDFAERYESTISAVRAHLFRICHHSLLEYSDLRERLSYVCSMKDFRQIVDDLEERVFQSAIGLATPPALMPHWICKPYYRPMRDDSTVSESLYRERRRAELDALAQKTGLSKRQLRKREKRKIEGRKEQCKIQTYSKCLRCDLPASQGCTFVYCRNCCRFRAAAERKDCKTSLYLCSNNSDNIADEIFVIGCHPFKISAHNFHFTTKIPWCYRERDGTAAMAATLISEIMGL